MGGGAFCLFRLGSVFVWTAWKTRAAACGKGAGPSSVPRGKASPASSDLGTHAMSTHQPLLWLQQDPVKKTHVRRAWDSQQCV